MESLVDDNIEDIGVEPSLRDSFSALAVDQKAVGDCSTSESQPQHIFARVKVKKFYWGPDSDSEDSDDVQKYSKLVESLGDSKPIKRFLESSSTVVSDDKKPGHMFMPMRLSNLTECSPWNPQHILKEAVLTQPNNRPDFNAIRMESGEPPGVIKSEAMEEVMQKSQGDSKPTTRRFCSDFDGSCRVEISRDMLPRVSKSRALTNIKELCRKSSRNKKVHPKPKPRESRSHQKRTGVKKPSGRTRFSHKKRRSTATKPKSRRDSSMESQATYTSCSHSDGDDSISSSCTY